MVAGFFIAGFLLSQKFITISALKKCSAIARVVKMADENFKDSFNFWQFLALVAVFVALLCLVPIVRWVQLLF